MFRNGATEIETLTTGVGGHRVHYLAAGGGPPVVLVHGGASDSRDWTETMRALAGRYRLYAPDIIGYGQSERRAAGYYLSDLVAFITDFTGALGLDRPALVGHSFGGKLCLEAARDHPERVGKLVLVDAAGLGRMSLFGSALHNGLWKLREQLRLRHPYPRLLTREGEEANWLNTEGLGGIGAPTLIIWKRHDPYLPLALARRAAAAIPGARLEVLPGYGHAPHKQNNAAFNHLLGDFLGKD